MAECKHAASERAMKAAVEMEIHAVLSTATVEKARALEVHFPAYDDLLAALKDCLDRWNAAFPEAKDYPPIQRAYAAISKAEGRSHD